MDGLIPQEGLTLLVGPPKSGKSWVVLGVAAACSASGCAFGTIPVEKRRVLYLALEDGQRRLQRRLMELQALDSEDLIFQTQWRQGAEGFADLETALRLDPKIDVVVIDTLGRLRGRTLNGRNQYEADYEAVGRIKQIADQRGAAIIACHHTRKAAADDFVDQISGTNAIAGAADTLLLMRRSRGTADGKLNMTGRDIEEERELALRFERNIGWTILGDARDVQASRERQEILDVITDAQRRGDDPLSAKAVADILEKNYNTTKNLIGKMVADASLRHGESGRGYVPA